MAITHERIRQIYGQNLLAVHSQTNKDRNPVFDMSVPSEATFAGRALNLPGIQLAILPESLEEAAVNHYTNTLKLRMPFLITPENALEAPNLAVALINDKRAIADIRSLQRAGYLNTLVYSAFEPGEDDHISYNVLRKAGIKISTEVKKVKNAEVLGNKAKFRALCAKFDVPQAPGRIVKSHRQLKRALTTMTGELVIKDPFGTAGEGIDFINAAEPIDPTLVTKWKKWIKDHKQIVVEKKVKGDEFSVHLYRHPQTGETIVEGVYRQLVQNEKKEDGTDGFAHYGSIFPIEDPIIRDSLTNLGKTKLANLVKKLDITGPICFDVLKSDDLPQGFHVLEAGAKSGANRYARMLALRVAESLFNEYDTNKVSAMFLAGINHTHTSFKDFLEAHQAVLQPTDKHVIVPMNLLRYQFGKADLLVVSIDGVKDAQNTLQKGLIDILGEEEGKERWSKIYNLTPPEHTIYTKL